MNPHDIIRFTQRKALPIGKLCERLEVGQKELVPFIATMKADGYFISLIDGHVSSRGPSVGKREHVPVFGATKPGRYHICYITDIHAGSSHFASQDLGEFVQFAYGQGCRVAVSTGDNLDGNKEVLLHDQTRIGFDGQSEVLTHILSKEPRLTGFFIDGNHDGYFSSSAGLVSGRQLEATLRRARLNWTFLGVCLGRVVLHGAKWQLWHPHGGASTRNAIRRILNERIEAMEEPCDILAMGHFHKYATVHTYPELTYGVAGGTWQKKGSEFANRISRGWDVGGTIVSYTVTKKGQIVEPSSQFYPLR